MVKQKRSIQAFSFPEPGEGGGHYKLLRKEINSLTEERATITPQVEIEITDMDAEVVRNTKEKSVTKQSSLNDEIFYLERQKEKEEIKIKMKRQQSLPENRLVEEKPRPPALSLKAAAKTGRFDMFGLGSGQEQQPGGAGQGSSISQTAALKVGLTKVIKSQYILNI